MSYPVPKKGEVLIEMRDPHSAYRVVGCFVGQPVVVRVLPDDPKRDYAVHTCHILSTKIFFFLFRDGKKYYVLVSQPVSCCPRCRRYLVDGIEQRCLRCQPMGTDKDTNATRGF
jgi:hypothetical protein